MAVGARLPPPNRRFSGVSCSLPRRLAPTTRQTFGTRRGRSASPPCTRRITTRPTPAFWCVLPQPTVAAGLRRVTLRRPRPQVFDVTRKATYVHLKGWFQELRKYCEAIPVICVANKIDVDINVRARGMGVAPSQHTYSLTHSHTHIVTLTHTL